jgi:hypothetical protein
MTGCDGDAAIPPFQPFITPIPSNRPHSHTQSKKTVQFTNFALDILRHLWFITIIKKGFKSFKQP